MSLLNEAELLKEKVCGEYEAYTGKTLEQYFMDKIAEEEDCTKIGGWWNKKSRNEIDIIALERDHKVRQYI